MKLSPHLDLLVENLPHLLLLFVMLCFLVLDLLLVKALAKFLDFTPFIVAYVRWQVFNLDGSNVVGQLTEN